MRRQDRTPVAAFKVCIKHEAAIIHRLEENDADTWLSRRVDRAERKRGRLWQHISRNLFRLLEQRLKPLDRIVVRQRGHPIARLKKLRMPNTQNTVAMSASAATTASKGMCGTLGVSAPRIPSET